MRRISFVLLLAIGGCDWLTAPQCDLILLPALRVTLVDSTTNEPVAAENIRVVFTHANGASDTVVVSNGGAGQTRVTSPAGATGTYRVDVIASGYMPWSQNGVSVQETEDGCHAATEEITARLQAVETAG